MAFLRLDLYETSENSEVSRGQVIGYVRALSRDQRPKAIVQGRKAVENGVAANIAALDGCP
jgi:hypothetical protein